jgi:uncharacterized Zn finger protein (UPF0148 family)
VALLKIKCPECGAGLKSPTGFTVGQTVPCPKCETYFSVEEPDEALTGKKPVKAAVADDDEDYDAPKKKKKRQDDDEPAGRSYRNSPLRYAVLGVLLVILGVLVVLFIQKKQREREEAKANDTTKPEQATPPQQFLPLPGNPSPAGVGGPKGPNPKLPNPKGPNAKGPNGGVPVDPLGGLLGGGFITEQEQQKLKAKYTAALVGTWKADLGNGVAEELTYTAGGTYTATRTGSAPASESGKYVVTAVAGSKTLRLDLTTAAGTRKIVVVFDDDEIEHPSLQPGVVGTFRKK